MHSRKPSIDSRTFAVEPSENFEEDASSTDSYDDLDAESQENVHFEPAKYLTETLQSALSSLEFNRSMAVQAQTSGKLKGKELELVALQEEAQKQLVEFQKRFQQGGKALQQVTKDLKWSHQKVKQLQNHVQSKYPVEYSQSKDKVVNRTNTDKEEEEIYI